LHVVEDTNTAHVSIFISLTLTPTPTPSPTLKFTLLLPATVVLYIPSMSAALERSKILLLGDSLTQTSMEGWGGGLAHRYQRRADVVNRGMSGYNTRWYLQYAKQSGIWYEPGNIALTTIFFGANDASLEKENPHHHVPLEEYKANLAEIVAKTQESFPESRILLITPPPIHHGQRILFQVERYGDKATGVLERTLESAGLYAEACKSVASNLQVPVLDMYTLMVNAVDDFGQFFYDGLHFNQAGHDMFLHHLLHAIESNFPTLHVEPDPVTGQPNNSGSTCSGIPSSGPYHDQIDSTKPEEAFQLMASDEL
jgi:isoamyl acetate esterase